MKNSDGKFLKFAVSAAMAGGIILLVNYFNLQQLFRDVLNWIANLGILGMLIFIIFYIAACVLFLPGVILTLGAGVIFGVLKGSILVSIGSTFGAVCAFLIGRYLARDWVSSRILADEKFRAVDDAVEREGWKIVLLTRLSPIFPFNFMNYAFGLTKVSLKHYFFASWLGMIPGTVMYVYIGSLAGNLAGLGSGGRSRSAGEWIFYGIGLLATLVVTIFVTRLAKKALAEHIPLEENKS